MSKIKRKKREKVLIFEIGGKFCGKLSRIMWKAGGLAHENVEAWKIPHPCHTRVIRSYFSSNHLETFQGKVDNPKKPLQILE